MNEKVRYAVVGAGWIAQEAFMPALAHTGNSELGALVTGNPEKGRELGKRYSIEAVTDYDGYDALLRSGVIDAVYLAVPNKLHRDYAVRAAEAGIHILCEKPLAPSEEDCRVMIDAAKANGVRLMTAYRLHFEEATVEALEAVRAGTLGEPRLFSSVFCQQVEVGNHRLKPGNWAGPLPDMGAYCLNMVRHVFADEPVETMAWAGRGDDPRFSGVDEAVSVLLRFPGDRLAQFTVSYGANPIDEYRIVGTKGDLLAQPGFDFATGLKHRLNVGGETTERQFPAVNQFGGEVSYFSRCIMENCDPEPDGEEGLADVRVMLAIEESLHTGRPQPIRPVPRPCHPNRSQIVRLPPVNAPDLVDAKGPGGD
jgi:predicted dehydrogenase